MADPVAPRPNPATPASTAAQSTSPVAHTSSRLRLGERLRAFLSWACLHGGFSAYHQHSPAAGAH